MHDTPQSARILDSAHEYVRRGWSVLPLHYVSDSGACSCVAGAECPETNRGKHPRWRKWTQAPAMSGADVEAHWADNPRDNVGIRTGAPSGFFVLDLDPKNGGEQSWEALLKEHRGDFPVTRAVLTGSGGIHYYLAMPDFEVTNSARRLPAGLDIRGTGGLVVAPPSSSAIGSYLVLNDEEIAPAPYWLLELLRSASGAVDVSTVAQEDLPAYADLDEDDQDRLAGYASRAVLDEVEKYVLATQGHGDTALFAAACAVLEIAQSPWNLTTTEDAYRALDAGRQRRAVRAAGYGGGQTDQDFERIWRSARSRTAGRGRPMPPDPYAGVYFDHPFAGTAVDNGTAVATGGDTDKSDRPGQVRRESGQPKTRAERLRSLLYARSALDSIPPPRALIEGALDVATVAVLSGKFGTYKSMVALSWACALASGKPWFGRSVPEARPVLYVAAEGLSGVSRRIRAWETAHLDNFGRIPDHMLQVIGGGVRITEAEDLAELDAIVKELGAGMLVLDTLHRCAPGLEENSAKDMGAVIEAVSMLRERNALTVLMLHHTGHSGQRARGSSAIEDDADASWAIRLADNDDDDRGPDNTRTMVHRKTKDGELSAEIPLELVVSTAGAYVDQAEGARVNLATMPKWLVPRALAKILDELGAPIATGAPRAGALLRGAGYHTGTSTDQIKEAVRLRKAGEHIDPPELVPNPESEYDAA